MKVIIVEPEKKARIAEIGNSLKEMQEVVGGDIEAVYFFDDPIAIICNEEGKINGLPLNRSLRDENRHILDIIAGSFFICGLDTDDFTDISDEMLEKYMKEFENPESFLRLGEKIIVIPYELDKV